MAQIQYARRLGLEPIVYLHERSFFFGGPNPYYEKSHGPNSWDYIYEPVGPSIDQLPDFVESGQVVTVANASELFRLFRWDPKSWFMNPYGYYRSVENMADGPFPQAWWTEQRDKAREFLNDGTVQFKPSILHQVQKFADENFSEDALGLQLRGSDKFDFGMGPNLARKVEPEEYFPHIDRYLSEHPKCKTIFVATDQRQWLKAVQARYPDLVVSFSEWSLGDTDDNKFHDAKEKAARGIEVVVDFLLLSRCSYAIKCHSAVGEMALVMNPDLAANDLNYDNQPYVAKSRALRLICAPLISALCWIWERLSDRSLGLETVVSVQNETVMVTPSKPRDLNVKVGAKGQTERPSLLSRRFVSDVFQKTLQILSGFCFKYEKR
ncbi:MAG: hypothetical protein ACSHXD_11620 [Marinosulfonomonas sp.]